MGRYNWRANISGTVDDLEELELMLRAVNGFCILISGKGLWIQDAPPAGAKVLPLQDSAG